MSDAELGHRMRESVLFIGKFRGHDYYQRREGKDLHTLRLPHGTECSQCHWRKPFTGPILEAVRYLPYVQDLLGLRLRFEESKDCRDLHLHFGVVRTFRSCGMGDVVSLYLNMPAGGQYCIQRYLAPGVDEPFEECNYWGANDLRMIAHFERA